MASTMFLLQQMEVLQTQGICKEAFLKPRLHTNYENLFRNKPEVLKLIRPYDQKTFETDDKIEKPFGIHIMRWIKTCISRLNNFNKKEKLTNHMNISR